MRRILIVKTGTTLPELRRHRGDYEDWIAAGLGVPARRLEVAAVYDGAALPDPAVLSGVVVTGSSAMVSHREPWSESTAAWLREGVARGLMVLGICYGHQLLAHALGGRVGPNPRGREIGTVRGELLEEALHDPLLSVLSAPLTVQVTHVESVLEPPAGATLLARSSGDPHFALAWEGRAWGVQFHPEFDADVIRAYLEARRERIREEGLDPEALVRAVEESHQGPALLRRFAELVEAQ